MLDRDECLRTVERIKERLDMPPDAALDRSLLAQAQSCAEHLLIESLQLRVENAHLKAQLHRHRMEQEDY